MSVISEKNPRHCGSNSKQPSDPHKLNKKHLYYISTFILSFISLMLLVWLILHPTKPKFSIQQAELNLLNFSAPSNLNTSIQLTIQSMNPNQKVGIYYDEFLVHASYKGQKITPETSVPPFYQGHEEANLLSAVLVGDHQPVSPSFGYDVERDQRSGKLGLSFKVTGRLRWKVGTWVSGKYRFLVRCVTFMQYGNASSVPVSSGQGSECSTTLGAA